MIFWIGAAVLSALAVALLLRPLARATAQPDDTAEHDLAVYRDQLAEVERDRAQGLVSAEEAREARLEIERRILAADAARAPKQASGAGGVRLLWLVLAFAVPLAAMGLYLQLGSPGTASRPFAERQDERRGADQLAALEAQLGERLTRDPEQPQAWAMLGEVRLRLGDYAGAAEAYGEAIVRGTPDANLYAARGEALTAAAGRVTPEAGAAFDSALALDPENPRARYYGGLAAEQAGRPREALAIWRDLAADSPAEAPWRAALAADYARVADSLGLVGEEARLPEGAAVTTGPTREDVEAAGEMSAEQRAAFIRSMVEGLEARLMEDPANPENFDGWLRLAHAYAVLGEIAKSKDALGRAEAIARSLPPGDPRREAFEDAGGLPQDTPEAVD